LFIVQITKSKEDTTHNRRTVFSYLQSKEAVTELFRTVAPKIAERNGGYTRIIKTGFRLGDAADMAMIELVDFNEIYNPNEEEKKTTRRSRRTSSPKIQKIATLADAKVEAKAEETVSDAVIEEELPTAEADAKEEKTEE
jgi:large subunit ribosomal protein L17